MSFRCGRVALVGKPNVGKSTILNAFVGQKVSIVSEKPQTTRVRILGIAHRENAQIIFLDTPGVSVAHTRLDRTMLQAGKSAFAHADLTVAVVDAGHHPGDLDKEAAASIKASGGDRPVILCLNKMDHLKAENVEGFVEAFCTLFETERYMMTQANRRVNLDLLEAMIVDLLPEAPPEFTEDEVTDRSARFLCAEFVREQILRTTRQEIPYAAAVIVDSWSDEPGLTRIEATIIVEKPSQRAILIGKQGSQLRKIGEAARLEVEQLLGSKVFLGLHIRVEEGWRMSPRILHDLNYSD